MRRAVTRRGSGHSGPLPFFRTSSERWTRQVRGGGMVRASGGTHPKGSTMSISLHKALATALVALTLSTTVATAAVSPALPHPNFCHDATTNMRIGQLVDGKCRSPEF